MQAWILFMPSRLTYVQVFQTYNAFSIILFQNILWKENFSMIQLK